MLIIFAINFNKKTRELFKIKKYNKKVNPMQGLSPF